EMGLGKTIQAIASINHFNQINEGTSLIVVPASLVDNWQAELSKFAPHLSCVALHGSDRDRLRETAQNADIVVTSYSTLVRDLAYHLKRVYCLVVADEASLIRNATTDTAKSLCKLQANARLALTGTPIENRIGDLWSLFQFVAPGYLGTFTDFKARYEGADQDSRSALQRLRLRISPFVLRRTKAEVAKDLPEKIEVDEWLTLDPEQERLYASLARSGLNEIDKIRREQGAEAGRMHLLTLLLRLRLTCVNPGLLDLPPERNVPSIKLQRLGEILNEQFESGKKTLVFSQFAENLRQIEQQWDSRYGKTWVLDGSSRNRLELVEEFQRYEGPAVFLISLKAGGYGLNLTAANTVIHLDPWWNPAVEAQATDRAHRIGQT